jgi:hypothetical protein
MTRLRQIFSQPREVSGENILLSHATLGIVAPGSRILLSPNLRVSESEQGFEGGWKAWRALVAGGYSDYTRGPSKTARE